MNENTLISILEKLQNQNIVMLHRYENLIEDFNELQIKLNYDLKSAKDHATADSLKDQIIKKTIKSVKAMQPDLDAMFHNLALIQQKSGE